MSVQPGPTFKRYAANGVATVYTIPFLLLDAGDLQITLNGTPVTTGFTLSGVGNPQSTCTFTSAPTGDLLFQMVIPLQRLFDYQMNGDFQSQTVNRDFDRLWLACKQLSRDSNRALTAPEPEGIPSLPVKAVRALKMLAFNGNGDPISSNLTMDQIEQQPALALASASAAAAAAATATAAQTASHASELAAAASAALAATYASDPWALQPIGVPIGVLYDIPALIPPTNNPQYRYVKLTASDSYNTGILTGESVTGSAPLVLATATLNYPTSTLHGVLLNLLNTERRFLRAGNARGLENDAFQSHRQSTQWGDTTGNSGSGGTNLPYIGAGTKANTTGIVTDGVNGTPRTDNETRVKNIGVTYFMRIK